MSGPCGPKSAEVRGGRKGEEQNRRLEFCKAKSTMTQYVMQDLVEKIGLEDLFFIDSVATPIEEIGNPVDSRAYRKPQEEGIHCGNYRARQLTRADYENFDITFKDVTEGCKALLNKIFSEKFFKILRVSRQWIRPGQRFDLAK